MSFSFKRITILWLILLPFLTLPTQVNGQTARLYLRNVPVQDEQLLVVTIQVADVVNLYGADLQLQFDPAQLRVRDENPRLDDIQIAPGPLLDFDNRFVVKNGVARETGLINFVFTLLSPAPPIRGEGILSTITFEIIERGPYSIEVVKAQLVSSQSEALPVVTENLYLNGDLQPNPTPVQISEGPPVWIIVALLGLLVVLAAGLGLRSKWVTVPAVIQRTPGKATNMPPAPARSALRLAQQGHRTLAQGDTEQAYELFSRAVELDPANAEAWLGKGLVSHLETEKYLCFQRVLALDPANAVARQELQQLEPKLKS